MKLRKVVTWINDGTPGGRFELEPWAEEEFLAWLEAEKQLAHRRFIRFKWLARICAVLWAVLLLAILFF